MFQIVSGMPLRLKFTNICTRRPITMLENSDSKRFGNTISDNRVDSTQKSNIVIDVCFQLKNQPKVEYCHRCLFSIEKSTEQIQFESFISQSQVYYKIRNQMSLQSLMKVVPFCLVR